MKTTSRNQPTDPRTRPRVIPRPVRGLAGSALVIAAAFAAGCGGRTTADYGSLELGDVGGTVTLDGKPLEGAVVRFYQGETRYSYGQTDADGYYTLRYNSEQAGVSPGEKRVFISTSVTGPEVKGGGGEELVPAKYNTKSELEATVEPNGSQTFDFALTGGGDIVAPAPREDGEEDVE